MSDQALSLLLDELEQLLQQDAPDGEALASWRARFDAALPEAERGPGWEQLVARCRTLAARLDAAANALSQQRDALRREMEMQDQGARALKGYRPS